MYHERHGRTSTVTQALKTFHVSTRHTLGANVATGGSESCSSRSWTLEKFNSGHGSRRHCQRSVISAGGLKGRHGCVNNRHEVDISICNSQVEYRIYRQERAENKNFTAETLT